MFDIRSEFINVTVGDILASGLSVLSEAYSKPGSKIRTLLILFILSDRQSIFASTPLPDVTLEIPGIFLYPNPPDAKLILPIPPETDKELVRYDILSISVLLYVNFSGAPFNDMLKDVDPTPKAV